MPRAMSVLRHTSKHQKPDRRSLGTIDRFVMKQIVTRGLERSVDLYIDIHRALPLVLGEEIHIVRIIEREIFATFWK